MSNKSALHVVSLPHTVTSKLYNACAYTQKVLNFCKMMHGMGYTVYHYGAQNSQVECTEHVDIISAEEQHRFFGDNDWKTQMFNLKWSPDEPYWKICNHRAIAEIESRRPRDKKDFLCLIAGGCQKPIADVCKIPPVEYGIGYGGCFAPYKVFESYTHMNYVYGLRDAEFHGDGRFYDAVIPNYYDVDDFPFSEEKDDYYLYIGRLIVRKGIQIAVEVADVLNKKLKICGQGVRSWDQNKKHLVLEEEVYQQDEKAPKVYREYKSENIQYLGYADVRRRGELMSHAKAVFVPTIYMEPFGGVNVEAQLCGTPVITTDWGAFPETVEHGIGGYRCHTQEQFVWAAQNVNKLDPATIRQRAIDRYSLEKVGPMYDEYFNMLYDIFDKGYYQKKERTQLDWLCRHKLINRMND